MTALSERLRTAYAIHSSRLAVGTLILFNLVPLAGVLWLGWDIVLILGLYWVENGIVGVINLVKILMAQGTGPGFFRGGEHRGRVSTALFFGVHYGLFWVGHGVFVFTVIPALAAGNVGGTIAIDDLPLPDPRVLAIGAAGLAISHAVSFWQNYVGRREFLRLSPAQLMSQPYGRLVILHLTIILGALVSIGLGTPLGSLLILIVLKAALDLYFHLRQHRVDAGEMPASADGAPPREAVGA